MELQLLQMIRNNHRRRAGILGVSLSGGSFFFVRRTFFLKMLFCFN